MRNFLIQAFAVIGCFICSSVFADETNSSLEDKYQPILYSKENPKTFILAGEIDIRTSLNFKRAIIDVGTPEHLVLHSPGGLVHVALDVALEVNRLGIQTSIPSGFGCYSACAFIFLAGDTRVAQGELGVHQISSDEADLYQSQLAISDIIDVLDLFETPSNLIVTMLRTPHEEMYIFNKSEMKKFGFHEVSFSDNRTKSFQYEASLSELEQNAIQFLGLLMDRWSIPNGYNLKTVSELYDDTVNFFGEQRTKTQVAKDKVAFMKRWPIRDYRLDKRRTQAVCNSDLVCKVDGFIIWRAESKERGKVSSGESKFNYTLKYEADRFYIRKEFSTVVKRN